MLAICLAGAALVLYAALCRSQRHKQRHAIEADYYQRRGPSLAAMTLEDAWKIQTWLAEQEFPRTLSTATFFALFKVRCLSHCPTVLLTLSDLWRSSHCPITHVHGAHDKIFPLTFATYSGHGATTQQCHYCTTRISALYRGNREDCLAASWLPQSW